DDAGEITVAALKYKGNPVVGSATFSGKGFDLGASFVDVKVEGLGHEPARPLPSQSLTVNFFAGLGNRRPQFWDGTRYQPDLSSGFVPPRWEVVPQGGFGLARATVVFDNKSRPTLWDLNGTVFGSDGIDDSPPQIDPRTT